MQAPFFELSTGTGRKAGRFAQRSRPVVGPGREQQATRLGEAAKMLAGLYLRLRNRPSGQDFAVVALELATRNEGFASLLADTPGVELLGDWPALLPHTQSFYREDRPELPLEGNVFHLLLSATGAWSLFARWQRYLQDTPLKGENRWSDLFDHLVGLWAWGQEHRCERTGLWSAWERALAQNLPWFTIELECWYRNSRVYREIAQTAVLQAVQEAGGELLAEPLVLDEIAYHGLLVRFPTGLYHRCRQVPPQLFYHPFLQRLVPGHRLQASYPKDSPPADLNLDNRFVATEAEFRANVLLLGGLPDATHPLLAGRIGLANATDATPTDRTALQHGTRLASLILHGDRNQPGAPTGQGLLCYPLLHPQPADWASETTSETNTAGELLLKEVKTAIAHALTQAAQTSDGPRVVLLAVNAPASGFSGEISPLARLLDHLAWQHGLLFIVASGNRTGALVVPLRPEELFALQGAPRRLQELVLQHLYEHARQHPLQAPAEAVNALTVGASHADAGPLVQIGQRYDLLQDAVLGSPLSCTGPGLWGAIKPDLLLPGGRQLYADQFYLAGDSTRLVPRQTVAGFTRAPGLRCAAPHYQSGQPAETYFCGTEGAAALAARLAARIEDALWPTLEAHPDWMARRDLLIKALLTHTARADAARSWLSKHLTPIDETGDSLQEWLLAYMGHGLHNGDLPNFFHKSEARFVASGELRPGKAARIELPFPDTLLQATNRRFMRLTLAWRSPILPRGGAYRAVRLWPDLPVTNPLGLRSRHPNRAALAEGTLWHEVFRSQPTARRTRGESLVLDINALEVRPGSLPPQTAVPWVLLLTFGTEPQLPLRDLFAEVLAQTIPEAPDTALPMWEL